MTPFRRRDFSAHPPAYAPAYKTTVLRSPRMPLVELPATPTEISGPVFGHNLIGPLDSDLVHNFAPESEGAMGERIIVHGRVIDQDDRPVRGALVEIWQANAGGRYRHSRDTFQAPLDPHFGGCGRTVTDEDGAYSFRTVRPGAYPWPNGPNDWRPAHIHFSLFGSGLAQRLITQMYFEGDPAIALCPIVQSVPDQAGIDLLTAKLDAEGSIPFDARAWRFDIVLRGPRATPEDRQS
ncbi:MAG: protocatechuate 3,4-dioxygenase subunit beta [Pseudomonadota bacterium]